MNHKKLIELLNKYCHGKLGVYMVPPNFYGQVPEAIKLSEYKVTKHVDNARGDLAERIMFFALKKYYSDEGDDVAIIHSHKFLNNQSNNEKDFIVINLTKGNKLEITSIALHVTSQSGCVTCQSKIIIALRPILAVDPNWC